MSYQIYVQHDDGVNYSLETQNCDGSLAEIRDALTCIIPVQVLRSAPFNLEWGQSVWAKITASNIIGTTPESVPGNGAIMLTSPDKPRELSNVPEITTGSQIGLIWTDGLISGGAPVIDYLITWDQGVDDFVTLEENILSQSYTVTGLSASVTYAFKV